VISTLWPIGDRSSAPFMARFYDELAAGRTVPTALRQAKRQAITLRAPPREWAGFVASGAVEARVTLEPRHRGRWWWAILPCALALLFFVGWRARR
jgi:hypothetical protein